jgi:hypothetical protein
MEEDWVDEGTERVAEPAEVALRRHPRTTGHVN